MPANGPKNVSKPWHSQGEPRQRPTVSTVEEPLLGVRGGLLWLELLGPSSGERRAA